ncbi:MAG: 4Fe-4S dicluster domain-containing protein [Candidatus Omnitrophota bacterium]
MKYACIKKEDINKWLEYLKEKASLYAPRKKENLFVFDKVKDIADIVLSYIPTILPPKKYYFPQKEKLYNFSISPFKTSKAIEEFEEYILFAVHTCDIAGIQCMDVVFREGPEDPNYLNRKEKMTIIGIECLKRCDKFSNCVSMGNHIPRGGYDLMMIDIGDNFILHINSHKGENIIKGLSYIKEASSKDILNLDRVRDVKKQDFKEEFIAPLTKVYEAFDKRFNSDVWEDVGRRCIACGNCTNVCPTCYCFDVKDELELNLNEGTRSRIWNSCQMDDFAKVAGGEDFRKGRDTRQRHRYYRKFKYPVDKFNRYFCIGCGRCTRTCMAEINLVDTVNSLLSKEEIK